MQLPLLSSTRVFTSVQVRAGIALAVALERTLILPELTCFCDRAWYRACFCFFKILPGLISIPLMYYGTQTGSSGSRRIV